MAVFPLPLKVVFGKPQVRASRFFGIAVKHATEGRFWLFNANGGRFWQAAVPGLPAIKERFCL